MTLKTFMLIIQGALILGLVILSIEYWYKLKLLMNVQKSFIKAMAEAAKETTRQRDLAACMYQAAGAFNFPERWLDVCNAAQDGEEFSTDGLLPIMPTMAQLSELHLELEEAEAKRAGR